MKIKTSHDYPPIPTRDADWSAVTDNYDWAPDGKDHPIGRGRTEQDAINDLVEQLVTEAFEDGYMTAQRDARELAAKQGTTNVGGWRSVAEPPELTEDFNDDGEPQSSARVLMSLRDRDICTGSYAWDAFSGTHQWYPCKPTHWQPLPAGPSLARGPSELCPHGRPTVSWCVKCDGTGKPQPGFCSEDK